MKVFIVIITIDNGTPEDYQKVDFKLGLLMLFKNIQDRAIFTIPTGVYCKFADNSNTVKVRDEIIEILKDENLNTKIAVFESTDAVYYFSPSVHP